MAKRETVRGKVSSSRAGGPTARAAFTLIELLVVLLILTLVIAITIPALGGARAAAKKSSTNQLLGNLQKSIATFQNDKGRLPGYFTAQEMGHPDNEDRGFTVMENMMLDLAGGVLGDREPLNPQTLMVGPHDDAEVEIDLGRFGHAEDAYFPFDQTNFIAQDDGEGGQQETMWPEIPDLVDAWDVPILAWLGNEAVGGPISDPGWSTGGEANKLFMVRQNSGSQSGELAHFYWASNAGFLNVQRLGRTGKDQMEGSLLGGADKAHATESLMAVLGSPSNSNVGRQNAMDIYPTAPRSTVLLHAAGPDGVYFSRTDSRGRGLVDGGILKYVRTWFSDDTGGTRLTNDEGQPTNRDLITFFDDITLSGGI